MFYFALQKEMMHHELSKLNSHKSNAEKKYNNKLAELQSGHRKKEGEQAAEIETLKQQCVSKWLLILFRYYCPSHVPVQTNFRRYFRNISIISRKFSLEMNVYM